MIVKVISVQQPWAQLIADRRRHIIIKGWTLEPGLYALAASHVVNREQTDKWYAIGTTLPTSAIVASVEVKKCYARKDARPSQFDYHAKKVRQGKLYAIVVRTVHKLRKPIPIIAPVPLPSGRTFLECELDANWQDIGTTSATPAK